VANKLSFSHNQQFLVMPVIRNDNEEERYLEVTVEVDADGALGTAYGDRSMHSDRVETAESGQVEAFRARVRDHGVDAVARRAEVDQIHGRLQLQTRNSSLHLFILRCGLLRASSQRNLL